jgi:hypothetical protein
MPSHKVHCYWDRINFGKSYRKIHEALDKPVWVLGRRHRIIFHDGWSASEVAKKVCPGDPVAVEVAAAHVLLDETCSNNFVLKKQLEFLADLDAKGRKRSGKKKRKSKKKKTPRMPSEKGVEKMMKQMLLVQQLDKLIRT